MRWLAIVISALLSGSLTWLVRGWAVRYKVVDKPDGGARKLHSQPVPLLGGLAVWLAVSAVIIYYATATDLLIGKDISVTQVVSIIIGGACLMGGGFLDDKYGLKPGQQIFWPVAAAVVAISGGVLVTTITNPLGGLIKLNQSWPYLGLALTFFWLLGMMYTTKLLDGLDGLVSGVGLIASLIIFGLTQVTPFYQPPVGLLALIVAGACAGFLVWNWHPAKIFLGEGGSLYIGFMLGVLAIISGSKIATALLVMGVPVLDVAWVIGRRLLWDRKSLAAADRRHLHHRLLDVGLSHRQAVVFLYAVTAVFGLTALFLGSVGKLKALLVLLVVMIILGATLVGFYNKKKRDDK